MSSSARPLLTTNALTTLMLLVGFASNIAIAAIFGLTRRVDAFYAAQMLPNLFMVLFLDYLGKNFLPTLAKAKKESEELASGLTSSIVTIVSMFALAVAIVLALSSTHLFGLLLPGFSPEDVRLVSRYFWIMAPTLVLMAATAFHQYVCQHDEQYVRIAAIRSALPLANLAAIILASPLIGEYALPVGYLLGHLIVFVLMARQARYRHAWRVTVRKDWEGKILSNSAIVMGSGLVARTRLLILNYFGSLLGGGAIAAIALSMRLTEPLGRTIFSAVRMFAFSRTARFAVEGNSREIARLYDVGLTAAFLLLAPLLWWAGLNSAVIVELLFVRGEFNLQMAALVSLALIGALPSVAFLGVNALLSNAFYAMDRILVPALVMPIGTLIYLGLAPLLASRYGVLGLTAGTSISSAVIFLVMLVLLSRHVPGFRAGRTFAYLIRYTAMAAASFGLPAFAIDGLGMPNAAGAALSLAVGTLAYVLGLLALRDPTLAFMRRYLKRAQPAGHTAGSPSA